MVCFMAFRAAVTRKESAREQPGVDQRNKQDMDLGTRGCYVYADPREEKPSGSFPGSFDSMCDGGN